jgi:hypothetical protein
MKMSLLVIACLLGPGGFAFGADSEVEQLKVRVKQLEAEVKALQERLAKLEGEKSPAPRPFKITVLPGEWGNAPPDNIEAVCRSAAKELYSNFPGRAFEPIVIQSDSKQAPLVVFGITKDGDRKVLLNVKGTYWSQFAYQSAHEFCHIACNYRDANRNNLWFEESLCETASLFVLRKMGESWQTNPPYSNWKSFALNHTRYAEDRIKETEKLSDLTFAQWYQRNLEDLRKTGVNRQKNQVVAVALLPLFEKNSKSWQAVSYLNQWDPKKELSFQEYLADWHQRVPAEHKTFVAEVAKTFGISLK